MDKVTTSLNLTEATRKAAKIKAIQEDTTLSNVVEALLILWLNGDVAVSK